MSITGLDSVKLRPLSERCILPCWPCSVSYPDTCLPNHLKHLGLGPRRSSHGELMGLFRFQPQTLSGDHRRPISREKNASCLGSSLPLCVCSELNGHLSCLWGWRMGLPWTAWLQDAAWVLREARRGGARCLLLLLEKPVTAQGTAKASKGLLYTSARPCLLVVGKVWVRSTAMLLGAAV